jgi:hypothetical protein
MRLDVGLGILVFLIENPLKTHHSPRSQYIGIYKGISHYIIERELGIEGHNAEGLVGPRSG